MYILTSLGFLVSKMVLSIVLAQLVSILRGKLWKVVWKCKTDMVSNLGPFSHSIEIVTLFSRLIIIESAQFFSGRYLFFLFPLQTLLGKLFLSSQLRSLSIPTTVSLKKTASVKQIKITRKNCRKGVSSIPLLRTHTVTMWSKSKTDYFFGILLSRYCLFKMSYFSWIPTMASLNILSLEPP